MKNRTIKILIDLVRDTLTVWLLWTVYQNSHWSVALFLLFVWLAFKFLETVASAVISRVVESIEK